MQITVSVGEPNGQTVSRLYRSLKLIRRVEETVASIYPSDRIKSPVHLSIGQESIAAGICDTLEKDDVVSATYRGHAAYIGKGGDLRALFAELYGKIDGCARGKGGSMHLVGMEQGILGTSAVVGTTVPIAMGYAFALKREQKGRVVVAFHGDGATEEGAFWESLNFSALHKLPILFVCENNGYAIHEPISKRWAVNDLGAKVRSFGLPFTRIDDGDVFKIRAAAVDAVSSMRTAQSGPNYIECQTYRWYEHVGPGKDYDAGYRPLSELESWQERDDVMRLAEMLDPAERESIDNDIECQIEDAVNFAEASSFPPIDELHDHVFSE